MDLQLVRDRLEGKRGRDYWRALERLADEEPFREWVRREWPSVAEGFLDPVGRRGFLRLMGASLALAGLGACTRQPRETILPYARDPEDTIPGRPEYFATTVPGPGAGVGVLVESHMGRPTKIEGNPDHPSSLGTADAIAQAAVLDLYDPDRSQVVLRAGRIASMSEFLGALRGELDVQRAKQGAGLRVLTGAVTSPTLARQLRALRDELPGTKWHQWEPANRDGARAGAIEALGRDVALRLDVSRADVIVALDADFLASGAGHLRHAREFAARRARDAGGGMNRLYAVEPRPTVTGAQADHRVALRASRIAGFAGALLAAVRGDADAAARAAAVEPRPGWIAALARDLRRAGPRALVVAGDGQPARVHAAVHRLHGALGCVGTTVERTRPVQEEPVDCGASLRELCDDMRAGAVEVLVVVGGNPVYDAPYDLGFAQALDRVPFRARWGLHADETSRLCHWHVPAAHFLEAWGDARAHDGTVGIVQPLIAPLYAGVGEHELVAALAGRPGVTGHDLVRETWRAEVGEERFEDWWRRALHDGVVADTRFPALELPAAPAPAGAADAPAAPGEDELELVLFPDPTVWDGRFANNGWLQECPKPISLLTWDNAALVSPATAGRLGVESEDVVRVATAERLLDVPVLVTPGVADGCLALSLGYGRRHAGRVAEGAGVDAYRLRASDAPWIATGVTARLRSGRRVLATTQEHHSMEGRDLIRVQPARAGGPGEDHAAGTAGHAAKDGSGATGKHAPGGDHGDTSLYPPHPLDNRTTGEGYAWGMVIDLNACLGCNACQVACQSENNVPVVGRDQVAMGRELHWIRVDRYFEERDDGETRVLNQPVPCMHCENAPCEVVCPVAATVHGPEGLNEMVYNRCVGTRYCSNNCPYKVRRFNFYRYVDDAPSLALQRNPDVTVRSRGVMEKCTYCVQRINQARIGAKLEDRAIREGEVRTACQATCPAQAIHFGDLNDPASRVSRLRERPEHYAILDELNTRPRTTYLPRFTNRNPELDAL